MTRSDEATIFYISVYAAVQEIPYGKVTSYGHIAKLIGTRMFGSIFLFKICTTYREEVVNQMKGY